MGLADGRCDALGLIDGMVMARIKVELRNAECARVLPTTAITFHPPEAMGMTRTIRTKDAIPMHGAASPEVEHCFFQTCGRHNPRLGDGGGEPVDK